MRARGRCAPLSCSRARAGRGRARGRGSGVSAPQTFRLREAGTSRTLSPGSAAVRVLGAPAAPELQPKPERVPSAGTERPAAPPPPPRQPAASAVTFPEPAGPGPDPSSRLRAWEREEAPQPGEQVPGGGQTPSRGRGVSAGRWRRRRAQADRRRRRGAPGRAVGVHGGGARWCSRTCKSGRGYSLSQDSRLSPSASAILQPPGPGPRPQTSRQPARAEPGRGLHGGLRGASACLRRLTGGRVFPFDSCLWASGLETLNAQMDGATRRLRAPRSLFPVSRHSLRHAEGSPCGVLEANQDGCPLGEGRARVLGPDTERAECCPAVPRVRGRRAAGRPLGPHREACEEGQGPRQDARALQAAWRPGCRGPKL